MLLAKQFWERREKRGYSNYGEDCRRAYGIDEIALVPGTRTLDPSLVDTSWRIGAIERETSSAMDGWWMSAWLSFCPSWVP